MLLGSTGGKIHDRENICPAFHLCNFFCPPRQETAFTKASGHPVERVVYLVGQKARLDLDPRGLGFHTPVQSAMVGQTMRLTGRLTK